MTRCIDFYKKVKQDGNFCGMSKSAYNEVMQYLDFVGKHAEISALSEDACKPLIREKDLEVQAKAIKALGEQLNHGNEATADQVRSILANKRAGVKPGGRIQKGDEVDKKKYQFTPRPLPPPEFVEVKPEPLTETVEEKDEDALEEDEVEEVEEEDVNQDYDVIPDGIQDIEEDSDVIPPEIERDPEEADNIVTPPSKSADVVEQPEEEEVITRIAEEERAALWNEKEERRMKDNAEEKIVSVLKSLVRSGFPKHWLSEVTSKAVYDVITPDGGCLMPDSGSVTKGGAITTNLGGR